MRTQELPALSGGMVALLGISHPGYLGHKAVSGLSMSKPEIRSHANEIGTEAVCLVATGGDVDDRQEVDLRSRRWLSLTEVGS